MGETWTPPEDSAQLMTVILFTDQGLVSLAITSVHVADAYIEMAAGEEPMTMASFTIDDDRIGREHTVAMKPIPYMFAASLLT